MLLQAIEEAIAYARAHLGLGELDAIYKRNLLLHYLGEDAPYLGEIDLKKAASAVKEKSIEMLKQKDLLPTTGYVHGGCSPVGMKKHFETVFDKTAEDCPTIVFSAGKIGYQVELPLAELSKILKFKTAPITVE